MDGNMQNAMRIIPALAVAVTLAACADPGSAKQAANPALAAHDPSMLGRGSSIVAAAVPDIRPWRVPERPPVVVH